MSKMLKLYKASISVILFLCFDIFVLSDSEVPRPRGVSISKAAFYPPADYFTCLDGLKTIKFTQINDDFCDCTDSSDEPGTSACSSGQFHCSNIGFKTLNIPSSRVNDGICDCCDGSDEYLAEINCSNECHQLGKVERRKEKLQQELQKKGTVLRNDLSIKGKAIKLEREARLAELKNRQAEAEKIVLDKLNIKNDADIKKNEALQIYRDIQENERNEELEIETNENNKEVEDTFTQFDSNKNNYIEIEELQSRIAFDKDRNGEVSVEEAKYFLDEQDRIDLESFKSNAWPRIKPYLMLNSGLFTPPDNEHEQKNIDQDEEGELSDLEQEDNVNNDYEEDVDEETGNGDVEEVGYREPEYDPGTQKLVDFANEANNKHSEAERVVREIEQEIKEITDAFSKDYGHLQEFASLDGECYTYEDREYIYKLCPFDRASQQQKSGGAETRLGSWDRWTGPENRYRSMLYSNGASCWNGPQRSANVKLECGLEGKLTAVTEPNRCEYQIVFETPAVCDDVVISENTMHDEL